jgi:hypothetical protein
VLNVARSELLDRNDRTCLFVCMLSPLLHPLTSCARSLEFVPIPQGAIPVDVHFGANSFPRTAVLYSSGSSDSSFEQSKVFKCYPCEITVLDGISGLTYALGRQNDLRGN